MHLVKSEHNVRALSQFQKNTPDMVLFEEDLDKMNFPQQVQCKRQVHQRC